MDEHYTSEEQYNIDAASSTEKFILKPWDSKAHAMAESIVDFLKKTFPEFEVYFIGSLALRISGSNDIDMNVYCKECSSEDIARHAQLISEKYSKPTRVEPTIAQWVFTHDGVSVDIILYNGQFEGADSQTVLHEKLAGSAALRTEYEAMKQQMDGKSVRDYVRGKILFFKRMQK